jgi:hypothetical protein
MEMLHNGFYSPSATCKAPNDTNDIAFLPAPFHWLYAVVGLIGHTLGIKIFLFLGCANAFFGAIYLWAVYIFLRTTIPQYARTAFILFTASGSVGGILYLFGLLFGWQSSPDLYSCFLRPSMYELVEGPYLTGTQHVSRLYYTLPLAHKPDQSPFPNLHPEIVTHADARLLDQLPQACVLAPQEFSDVLALRVNTQVLGGT